VSFTWNLPRRSVLDPNGLSIISSRFSSLLPCTCEMVDLTVKSLQWFNMMQHLIYLHSSVLLSLLCLVLGVYFTWKTLVFICVFYYIIIISFITS
jgi:hypothetical protein